MAARHRLSKLLLRHGRVYEARAWTKAHDRWLRRQATTLDSAALRLAFDTGYETVLLATARRDRLDVAIEEMAADSQFTPVTRRLGCLRGVSTLTGFGLAVEVGDWHRFTGSAIGAYLGLVPSEASSGSSRVQGSITKTGNGHARRLLVEAAWQHRKPYRSGATIQARWVYAPAPAVARGHAGNHRLHRRWRAFDARNKQPSVANVAIARELAGWCWSLAVLQE
jgi:transposase